jgi:hypothetical protein
MSYEPSERAGGANSAAWVVLLVLVLVALLAIPVVLGIGFFAFSRVTVEPQFELVDEVNSSNGLTAGSSVSVNDNVATITSGGVTITAVADGPQWQNSQLNSTDNRTQVTLDSRSIVLENLQLSIDSVVYGAVQPGDQVCIEGAKVTVNGQERTPAAEAKVP